MEAANERESTEIQKLRAEITKLMAETAKINRETHWYPIVVGAGLMGAGAALAAAWGALIKKFFI